MSQSAISPETQLEYKLIGSLLLLDGSDRRRILAGVSCRDFEDETAREIYQTLSGVCRKHPEADEAVLLSALTKEQQKTTIALLDTMMAPNIAKMRLDDTLAAMKSLRGDRRLRRAVTELSISKSIQPGDIRQLSQLADEMSSTAAMSSAENYLLHYGDKQVQFSTGFSTLDDLLNQTHEEYKGKTPREIESKERVQMAERLKIFLKVCDMVAYAHEKHVLHRDLKPANIMLGKQDDVYVMDWGIAEPHESDEPIQAPEDTTGTVCYLAPEIIRRKKYDERSDVYSLGLVLFDLVYLHPAFVQMDEHLTCYYAVRGKTSHRKHEYGYRVPNWLRLVIDHAIWLDPDKRTPSVAVLMEQIRRGMAYDASLWGRLKRLIGM